MSRQVKHFSEFSDAELADLCRKRYVFSKEQKTLVYSATRSGGRPSARAGKLVGSVEEKSGYLRVSLQGRMCYVQHIVWLMNTGEWPKQELDHKDRIRINNSFDNLRLSTSRDNQLNRSNNLPFEDRYLTLLSSGNYSVGLYDPNMKKIFYFGTYSLEKARKVRDTVESYYPNYKEAKEKYLKGEL